jgi:c-di-GMP-related signal transduction protein
MKHYIARHPIFNRKMEVFGYKLILCQSLRDYYYDLYTEPNDAEELYHQLCFAADEEMHGKPAAFIEFSDELFESLIPLLPRKYVIVECESNSKNELTNVNSFIKIKAQEYRVAYDATENIIERLVEIADIIKIDVTVQSAHTLTERVKSYQRKAKYLAYNVETWDDYKKAFAIGYDYFQGSFFLKPFPGKQNEIRSFNVNILRVISELGQPEPSFREIANIIEHDLSLSYRLLKLVNSAYIAPRFKVKTISQGVTILGLNELNKFMSAMLMRDAQSPGNTELLRRSLIRGKLLEFLAEQKHIPQKGTEAFFTGIFSLLDVILNREMEDIMGELPLTDTVKEALKGETNELKALLDMVIHYEQADWESFSSLYKPDLIQQEELVNDYMSALIWAESLDF